MGWWAAAVGTAVLLLFGTQMPGAWRDEAFRVTHLPWQTGGGPLRSLRQHGLPGPRAAAALVPGPGNRSPAKLRLERVAQVLVWSGVQASDFILSPKMRLRLLLVVMVIALVLTRSRMGNAAFFAAMLIVGSIAIVLARKTAPKTIALIASDYGLLGLGLLGALVALTLWTVLAVLARRRSSQSRSWRRKAEARDHFDGARAFGTIDGDASG